MDLSRSRTNLWMAELHSNGVRKRKPRARRRRSDQRLQPFNAQNPRSLPIWQGSESHKKRLIRLRVGANYRDSSLRRTNPPTPSNPDPSKANDAGSGTGATFPATEVVRPFGFEFVQLPGD